MDLRLKDRFMTQWTKYFNQAELPLTFYYTDQEGRAPVVKAGQANRCVIAELLKARRGKPLAFGANSIGCLGGKMYLGFRQTTRPDLNYFLSCGIPGKLRGERYKKTPQLASRAMKYTPPFKAPGRFAVFKRWDMLENADTPQVVVFFAEPDVLAGLFTLASFDEAEPNGVITPFGSGCSTIVRYPYLELDAARPRAVIGMFDISARPFVSKYTISFAVPMKKFVKMVGDMEESFLVTDSWKKIQKRIA